MHVVLWLQHMFFSVLVKAVSQSKTNAHRSYTGLSMTAYAGPCATFSQIVTLLSLTARAFALRLLGDVVAAGLGLPPQDMGEPWSNFDDVFPHAPSVVPSCLQQPEVADAMPPASPAIMLRADHVEAPCMLLSSLGCISGAGGPRTETLSLH